MKRELEDIVSTNNNNCQANKENNEKPLLTAKKNKMILDENVIEKNLEEAKGFLTEHRDYLNIKTDSFDVLNKNIESASETLDYQKKKILEKKEQLKAQRERISAEFMDNDLGIKELEKVILNKDLLEITNTQFKNYDQNVRELNQKNGFIANKIISSEFSKNNPTNDLNNNN